MKKLILFFVLLFPVSVNADKFKYFDVEMCGNVENVTKNLLNSKLIDCHIHRINGDLPAGSRAFSVFWYAADYYPLYFDLVLSYGSDKQVKGFVIVLNRECSNNEDGYVLGVLLPLQDYLSETEMITEFAYERGKKEAKFIQNGSYLDVKVEEEATRAICSIYGREEDFREAIKSYADYAGAKVKDCKRKLGTY